MEKMKHYFQFEHLLRLSGWQANVRVAIDEHGTIQHITQEPAEQAVEYVRGYTIPGFVNAHSHAFQYAMAGLAETHPAGVEDDFWTWREAMYQCALSISPDEMQAVAAMLYAEMLRVGYTHVVEFHYLHHDPTGKPYANIAEMGERLLAAASQAGIGITLIPVFYQTGNFGQDFYPRQRRFISNTFEAYARLADATKKITQTSSARWGVSIHSLRAVKKEDCQQTFSYTPNDVPFHLHIAEQKKEVEDCLHFYGKRPVEFLFDMLPVSEQFHLVHATHITPSEMQQLFQAKANVVLCPSTEGNLGDGIFPFKSFCRQGGSWSIGTDSHIGLNPWEEIRMMDYRQRLLTHQRNTMDGEAAFYYIQQAWQAGQRALGNSQQDFFEIGKPLHALVLKKDTPLLSVSSPKHVLSTFVYTGNPEHHEGTLAFGKWVVKDGRHQQQERIFAAFKKAMNTLQNRQ